MQTENQRFYYQDYSRDIIQSMCWVKPNQEAEWQERTSLGARELSKKRHPEGQQPAWHILSVLNYKVGSARKTSRVAGHSIFWVTLPKCFRAPSEKSEMLSVNGFPASSP